MSRVDSSPLFDPEAWTPALEKYARVTHLTVTLYDAEGQVICGPILSSSIFKLFSDNGHEPGLWTECLNRCLGQREPQGSVIVAHPTGLGVVGVPLLLNGGLVGAAVAGYHLLEFPQTIAVDRWAREAAVPVTLVWEIVRHRAPVSRQHFAVQGELLQVLGDTLLKENFRARQHAELSARLQTADTAKDQFVAMVSHELRGPLNTILGWVRLLRTEHLGEPARERALETIERNAVAQVRLVEDLLAISRLMTGKARVEQEPVALGSVVSAAVDDIAPAAKANQIHVDVRLDEIPGRIAGDPQQIQQIVGNLLSNAVKFTPRGGAVSVRLTGMRNEAELAITDTGEGINPEFLPHIFEPFQQQDSSAARVHGGLGLGLTIARHLVALHGGSIRAESPGPGRGSTFTLTFPLIGAPASAEAEPSNERAQAGPVRRIPLSYERAEEHAHVLVVEDDTDARELLQTVIERAGFDVTAVRSAREAIAVLDESRPAVLVSDIGLAGQDGYSLIRTIRTRAFERGGDIPAIALTAFATAADRTLALSAGYQLHLAKPVDNAELIRAIESLAEPHKSAGASGHRDN